MLEVTISPLTEPIDSKLEDEQTQIYEEVYVEYEKDLASGMAPCLFADYFKDCIELRIIREYKVKTSKGVSN